MADAMGYTVMHDLQGWWVYTKKTGGELISSGIRVGDGNPRKLGLTKNLQANKSKRRVKEKIAKEHRDLLEIPSTALCNFRGTKEAPCVLKSLVLLVRFADHDERNLPAQTEYDLLFNHIGPATDDTAPTGSIADVFRVNSYDKFLLQSTITPWIRVNRTEAQTVDDNMGLNQVGTKTTWREAMTILESTGFDFNSMDLNTDSILDCLVVLHSGAAAEIAGDDCESDKDYTQRVWSHASSQTWFVSSVGIRNYRFYVASGVWDVCPSQGSGTKWEIARIAIIAHECAHFLGLPDLYGLKLENGFGVGSYDLLGKYM
jgi:M6 family metalloprotease-like protein